MSIPKKDITVVLVGNPNIGKSTIFNSLTGANQSVGNYPGVTVEKKDGFKSHRGYNINFVDLPGIYSLSAYSDDEIVSRDFLVNEKLDIVINVIDASKMERSLYLFTQIVELGISVMIVLNMIDILGLQGKVIDKEMMSNLLGVPVFIALTNKDIGITSILDYIVDVVEEGKLKKQITAKVDYGENIKEEIDKLEKLISKDPQLSKFPKSWLSIKLLDNDPLALKLVCKTDKKSIILSQLDRSREHIKRHFGNGVGTEIADRRYGFANSVVKTVIKKTDKKKIDMTEIIDNFVLNKYLGTPIFVIIIYIIFKFAFVFSEPIVNIFEKLFERLSDVVRSVILEELTRSLVVDGIIGGLSGVLGFFPLILLMFLAIAFFEDSGYMARAAFVMDKIMSKFGLHGKSFLPLMISTNGCAVPGILSTRTLDSKRDRIITMFVVPFMICGAKLPVCALITGAFFSSKNRANIMSLIYILSVIIAFATAKILSKTLLKGEPAHFVMELPPYHMPQIKGLLLKMWERSWLYLRKAGTVVVFMSVLVWAVFAYPRAPVDENLTKSEKAAVQLKYGLAGRAGKILEPLFKPIGMDASRTIAFVAGLAAKETIVSTLGTIYSIEGSNSCNSKSLRKKIACDEDWSPLKGLSFLVFCLIYTPCAMCVIVFFKESGSSYRYLALIVVGNAVFAWVTSFVVFQIGTLLKIGV
ncbi:MAG: ferrous iron transport protein B [Endomicrobium sp.]|nr:ferrous iron transport protein B [Endomicrobium sp.]